MRQDLTRGGIAPLLIKFTIPLVLGNLFQLVYNATDSIIVGRFVGSDALAAIGASTPVVDFSILFISGMCMGAGVLMSAQYGAKHIVLLRRQISTAMLGGLVFSVVFALFCIAVIGPILRLLLVPQEIMGVTTRFLQVMFCGLGFTFLYNFLANVMRALGDSRTPLVFLMISAALNVLGDVILVVWLGYGVVGSAVSTVICEGLCCLLCAMYIHLRVPLLRLGKGWLVFDPALLRQTVNYGTTSALQQACLQLGKIIIQLFVNSMGVSTIAAFSAVNRVDDFAYTPEQNIGHGMTTLLAQNRGARQFERIRRGFMIGMLIEVGYSFILFFAIYFGAHFIMSLFVQQGQTAVMAMGSKYLRLIAVMYILPSFTNGVQGYFRGMGDLKITLASTLLNMVGRVGAAYLLTPHMGLAGLAWANLAGWILMLIGELPLLAGSIRRGVTRDC